MGLLIDLRRDQQGWHLWHGESLEKVNHFMTFQSGWSGGGGGGGGGDLTGGEFPWFFCFHQSARSVPLRSLRLFYSYTKRQWHEST